MTLYNKKKGTVTTLQGITQLIDVVQRSSFETDECKADILNRLHYIESKLNKSNERLTELIDKVRCELQSHCSHDQVNHIVSNHSEYFECIVCGAIFRTPPSDVSVIKRIELN